MQTTLSNFLWQGSAVTTLEQLPIPETVQTNYPSLLPHVFRNHLTSLLYKNLKNHTSVPASFVEQLKQRVQQTTLLQLRQEAVFLELHRLLTFHGIDYRLLKGFFLARAVYPEVYLRPMGDIDIMVPPQYTEKVFNLLKQQGYTPYAISEHQTLSDQKHHPYGLRYKGVTIELHKSIFAGYDPERIAEEKLWENPVEFSFSGITAKTLPTEVFLFHLCHHLMGHLRGDFIKLIWCHDIVEFIRVMHNKINWDYFVDLFYEAGGNEELLHGIRFAYDSELLEIPDKVLKLITTTPEEIAADYLWFAEHEKNERPRPHLIRKFAHVQGTMGKLLFLFHKMFPVPEYILGHYRKRNRGWLLLLYPRYVTGFVARGIKALWG